MGALASTEVIAAVEAAVRDGSPARRLRMLIEIVELLVSGAGRLQQEHIRVFDDLLVRLIERTEARALAELSALLAEPAPVLQETVRRLARHEDAAVASPILLKSRSLSDRDLLEIASKRGQQHLLALSARSSLGEELTDLMLMRAGKDVSRALAKNVGARFSSRGYSMLLAVAGRDDNVAESLGTRADLPAELLRELLAKTNDIVRARLLKAAPQPLRERIRTVVDSQTAKDAKAHAPTDYSEALRVVDGLNHTGSLNDSTVNRFAVRREYPNLIAALSVLSGGSIDVIAPLMEDEHGWEGLIIACRASRLNWQTTLAVINNRNVPKPAKQQLELGKSLFETLYVSAAQYTMRFEPPGCSSTEPRDKAVVNAGGGR